MLIYLFLIGFASCVELQPKNMDSIQIIDLIISENGNQKNILSYANNILFDENQQANQILKFYFMSDLGEANIFLGKFATNGSYFTVESVSPFSQDGSTKVCPFLSFDMYKNNIIGISLPSNLCPPTSKFPIPFIQTILMQGQDLNIGLDSTNDLQFFTTYISSYGDAGSNYVYFAGWNPDVSTANAFVVVQALVDLKSSSPSVHFDPEKDVLQIPFDRPCYDQFGSRAKPSLNTSSDGQYLYLLVPGRCGTIAQISINRDSFKASDVKVFPTSTEFTSSLIYDYTSDMVYYTTKDFQGTSTTLSSFDLRNWTTVDQNVLAFKESEALLVLGNDQSGNTYYRWIFVIASGSNQIYRLRVRNGTFNEQVVASITSDINRISSAFYYSPWLFWTTNEPSAKIVRIAKSHFCQEECGPNSYCQQAFCICRTGYTQDIFNKSFSCIPFYLAERESLYRSSTSAVIAVGVLFSLFALAAILGWFLWWRKQKGTPQERRPIIISSVPSSDLEHQIL